MRRELLGVSCFDSENIQPKMSMQPHIIITTCMDQNEAQQIIYSSEEFWLTPNSGNHHGFGERAYGGEKLKVASYIYCILYIYTPSGYLT